MSDQLWEHIDTHGLGYSPASITSLEAAENRLGRKLPPSYKAFLQVTDGWATVWPGHCTQFFSIETVDLYSSLNPENFAGWMDGLDENFTYPVEKNFVYGTRQDSAIMSPQQLRLCFSVSEDIGWVCLLNPERVTSPDGEWETWYLAPNIQGGYRYQSFAEFMMALYNENMWELGGDLDFFQDIKGLGAEQASVRKSFEAIFAYLDTLT